MLCIFYHTLEKRPACSLQGAPFCALVKGISTPPLSPSHLPFLEAHQLALICIITAHID